MHDDASRMVEDVAVERWLRRLAQQAIGNGDRNAHSEGPRTFRQIEQAAREVARRVERDVCQRLLLEEAERLGEEQPCPQCGKHSELQMVSRPMTLVGGNRIEVEELRGHCPACRRDFFPATHGLGSG